MNYLQEQKEVKISTTIQKTDYQDLTITGNQDDIEKTIHSISKIILCKNFQTDNLFGIDYKFKHINNINYTQENHKTQKQITHKKTPSKPDNNRPTKSNCKSPNNTGTSPKDSRNYNENEIETTNKQKTRRSKEKQKNTPEN